MSAEKLPNGDWPAAVKANFRAYVLAEGISRKTIRRFSEAHGPAKRTLNRWALELRNDPEVQADAAAHTAALVRQAAERKEAAVSALAKRIGVATKIADESENESAQLGALNALAKIVAELSNVEERLQKAAPADDDKTAARPDIVIVYPADVPKPDGSE